MHAKVPFGLTQKMAGILIVRLGGKGGKGKQRGQRPRGNGGKVMPGKSRCRSLAGAQWALGMTGDQRDWKDGREETRQIGRRWAGTWACTKLKPRTEGELGWSQHSGCSPPDFLFIGSRDCWIRFRLLGMENVGHCYLFEALVSILLEIYPEVQFLDHMVVLFLIFGGTSIVFP